MKGIDTNILVRYLVQDDAKQGEIAANYFETLKSQGETCFINHIVLCELVWVLRAVYKLSRDEIINTLESVLKTDIFEFENKDAIWKSIQQMKIGKADFSDYLIGQLNAQAGCTETVSFDKKISGVDGFRIFDLY